MPNRWSLALRSKGSENDPARGHASVVSTPGFRTPQGGHSRDGSRTGSANGQYVYAYAGWNHQTQTQTYHPQSPPSHPPLAPGGVQTITSPLPPATAGGPPTRNGLASPPGYTPATSSLPPPSTERAPTGAPPPSSGYAPPREPSRPLIPPAGWTPAGAQSPPAGWSPTSVQAPAAGWSSAHGLASGGQSPVGPGRAPLNEPLIPAGSSIPGNKAQQPWPPPIETQFTTTSSLSPVTSPQHGKIARRPVPTNASMQETMWSPSNKRPTNSLSPTQWSTNRPTLPSTGHTHSASLSQTISSPSGPAPNTAEHSHHASLSQGETSTNGQRSDQKHHRSQQPSMPWPPPIDVGPIESRPSSSGKMTTSKTKPASTLLAPLSRTQTIAAASAKLFSNSRPSSRNAGSELCKAAADGNLAAIGNMLDTGYDVGAADPAGWTALHRAVQQGHEAIVRLLLARGASAGIIGPSGLHPLHIAVMAHDASITRILLEHGASPEAGHAGITPFQLAVSQGVEDLVKVLVEHGANPKALVEGGAGHGETAIHMAVAAWHGELIPLLIQQGIDVNTAGQNPKGQTALHIAAWYGYESAARMLLDAGANVDARYATGETALHEAAKHGQVKMLELLILRGADIMASTPAGETALTVAVSNGKKRAAELLIDRMSSRITPVQKAFTLISAAGAGQLALTELLLRKEYPVNGHRDGVTALDLAANFGHESVVLLLLGKGANPNVSSTHARPSMDWASDNGHTQIVGLLNGTIPRNSRAATPPKDSSLKDTPIDHESVAWSLAMDSTFHSKRLVMANPNPGGFPPKCHVCLDLDFRRGAPKDAEVQHIIQGDSIAASAARKCPGCSMVLTCLQHLGSAFGVAAWNTAEAQCELRSLVQGGPLYVTCGPGATRSTVRAEIYSLPGRPTSWPVVGSARHVPPVWCEERISLTRALLDECLTTHKTCAYNENPLPHRVIDVGSDTQQPLLHLSNGEKAKYITLSHCWGGSSPITTTTDTLDARVAGIPFADLPKTFQEAVLMARGLGVQYLWIDSLCILQDSVKDWEEQSSQMSTIYAHSYLTLAADASPDCQGGCFPSATSQSFSYGVAGPGGRNMHVYFRLNNLLHDDRGEVCHRLYDTRDNSHKTPLDRRGWTLQERILSPRTLHFGRSELGWECATRRLCECQVVPTQIDTDARFKAHLIDRSDPKRRLIWSNIVEEFTHRDVTRSRDRLPALSGLAQEMVRRGEGEYVVGMWRDQLPSLLMWKPDYNALQGAQAQAEAGDLPKRHKGGYYAPSWSWASIMGPVTYEALSRHRPFESGWSKPFPVNRSESSWVSKPEISIVDVQITSGRDPYSNPRAATLTVRGPVATALFEEKTKAFPMHSSKNGGLLIGRSAQQADFEPDVRDRFAEARVGDELLLLFVGESAKLRSDKKEKEERDKKKEKSDKLDSPKKKKKKERKKQESTEMAMEGYGHGLVLKKVEVADRTARAEEYMRVGTFRYVGRHRADGWKAVRGERTLRLV